MPALRIDNFGGEMPSVSPRALPAHGAQENRNLYLGTAEFRPLAVSQAVASAISDAKTLYKFNGQFTSFSDLRSHVRGQINEEKTERTYYTFDDGSARPRAKDNQGNNRELGVWRPAKPVVTANVVDELTRKEAEQYVITDLPKEVREAADASIMRLHGNELAVRWLNGQPRMGAYSTHGLTAPTTENNGDPGSLYAIVPKSVAEAQGFDLAILGVQEYQGAYAFPIKAAPYCAVVDEAKFKDDLMAIQVPEGMGEYTGVNVFGQPHADILYSQLIAYLNIPQVTDRLRADLDAMVAEFYEIIFMRSWGSMPTPPNAPDRPIISEYYYDREGGSIRRPAWIAHEASARNYTDALKNYEKALAERQRQISANVSRLQELQQRSASIVAQLENILLQRYALIVDEDISDIYRGIETAGDILSAVNMIERDVQSRFYIVTFVTDWGEESAPSEPTDMVEVDQNDTVTIQRPISTRHGNDLYDNHIRKWRIYRSASGSMSAAFLFVDELATSVDSYTDSKKGGELGEPCPTITWEPPPYRQDNQNELYPKPVVGSDPYLRGLTGMPNGIMAGFFDRTVAFCEPYTPYAWPIEYQISLEYDVVGLGVFGQTLFVGTTGKPYFISGADSASMSAQKLDAPQACTSARSIVGIQGGVIYASPDGLCLAEANGVTLITAGLYTREDWQALKPSTMHAAAHESTYYLWYEGQEGGCLAFDLSSKKLGRIDMPASTGFTDIETDSLYIVDAGQVRQAAATPAQRMEATWRSCIATMPREAPVSWVSILGDQSPSNPITFRWYADGVLRHTATFTNTKPQRLPHGRWIEHEMEIQGKARITRLTLAGNTQELQGTV